MRFRNLSIPSAAPGGQAHGRAPTSESTIRSSAYGPACEDQAPRAARRHVLDLRDVQNDVMPLMLASDPHDLRRVTAVGSGTSAVSGSPGVPSSVPAAATRPARRPLHQYVQV